MTKKQFEYFIPRIQILTVIIGICFAATLFVWLLAMTAQALGLPPFWLFAGTFINLVCALFLPDCRSKASDVYDMFSKGDKQNECN